MSDKELNINIRTTADTSGADQTAEAINKTREAAQGAGESAEALDKVVDALDNAKTGAEEATQAVVKETEAEQDNTQTTEKNTQSKEKSTSTKRKRKKAIEDETKATRDNKKATEDATQAVDKDTKERTENTAAVEKQGNALENTGKKGEQAGGAVAKGGKQGAAAVKNMGNGALQAAYFFDDLQYGIRGVMNNIPGLVMGFGGSMGLAGALSLAVLAGKVLYDLLDETDGKGKSASENAKQLVEAEKERLKNLFEEVEKLRRDEDNNAALDRELDISRKIAENRKDEAEALEYAYSYRKRLIDLESGISDDKAEEARLKVEEDFANGKLGAGKDAERKRRRLLLGIELDSNARRRAEKEEKSIIDVSDSSTKKMKALKTKREAETAIQDNTDSNVISLFDRKQLEVEFNRLVKKAAKLRSEGREEGAHNIGLQMNDLRHMMEKSDNALQDKGYNLGDGTSGEKGYSEAYKAYHDTVKKLEDKHSEAEIALSKAKEAEIEATRRLTEVKLKNASEAAVDVQREKTVEAQDRRQIKKEDEKKQNQEKKRLDQEAKRRQKEDRRKEEKEANDFVNTIVEGLYINTGNSKNKTLNNAAQNSLKQILPDIKRFLKTGNNIDKNESNELVKMITSAMEQNGITEQSSQSSIIRQLGKMIEILNNAATKFKETNKKILGMEDRLGTLESQFRNL